MKKWSFIAAMSIFFSFNLGFGQEDSGHQNKVEQQWAVCGQSAKEVALALKLDINSSEKSKLSFIDFKNEALSAHGLQIKIKYQDSGFKTTVKFSQDQVYNPALYTSEKLKCEWDQYYNSDKKYACSLNQEGSSESKYKMSVAQRSFIEKALNITMDEESLVEIGPFNVETYEDEIDGIGEKVVVDALLLPSADQLTEISVRSSGKDSYDIALKMNALISKKGIPLCPNQVGKYRRIIGH